MVCVERVYVSKTGIKQIYFLLPLKI